MSLFTYKTSIGNIGIEESKGRICRLYLATDVIPKDVRIAETPILKEAARQIEGYLTGELKEFSLPLASAGTPFMEEVWQLLCEIPYGETLSYKQLAEKAGRPKAARAVGLACNRNPLPLFIPCHRVVGSSGKLAGYRGGLEVKEKLLLIEKTNTAIDRHAKAVL